MKIKSTILSLAATAAFVGSSSAVTIDIVGSTAGRTAVYNQILALVNPTGRTSAHAGSSLTGANQAIIKGNLLAGGAPVTVRLNFTGSAAGVNQVVNRATLQVSFFRESVLPSSGNAPGVSFTTAANIENSAAEIGYSDVFQSTTSFKLPVLLAEDEVAVIPFQFFKHSNGNPNLVNISSQFVRALYGAGGAVPMSLATGNPLDAANTIYAIGRDASSGTRITTFAEVATSQTAVSQYQPTTTQTNGTGSVIALGNTTASGFTSGSFVANVLNSTYGDGTTETIIGYLGASDWPVITATNPAADNAVALSFNGVPYSLDNLRNGSYTFWGYLHQFNNGFAGFTTADATVAGAFYESLRAGLESAPGSGVEPISAMLVSRDADGAVILPAGQ